MSIHYQDEQVTLHEGDCLDVLRSLPDNSVDAVITDPPYGLEFMGKDWDAPWKASGDVVTDPADVGGFQDGNGGNPYSRSRIRYGREGESSFGFQQWCQQWAAECLRVLRPGGFIAAFGGTRTFHRLACAIEDAGFEIRDSIAWLYGSGFPKSLDVSKAIDKAAGAEREVTGIGVGNRGGGARTYDDDNYVWKPEYQRTDTPATDAAKQWQGWGTALKPSWESIVCAVKPPLLAGILDSIGSHLDRLESECKPPANAAAPGSAPTHPGSHAARTGSAPVNAATAPAVEQAPITGTGAAADSPAATDTSASESTAETYLNTVTSWRQCWAELCDVTSTYTTATNANLTTDLKTLNSCLSQVTPVIITAAPTRPSGLNSLATAADNLFGACVLSSRATRALSVAETATSGTPIYCPVETGNHLTPIVVARKPIQGTVASNVLAHGTGALNIDACRIAHADDADLAASLAKNPGRTDAVTSGVYGADRPQQSVNTAGRWPPNAVLDGAMADELDKQSGTTVSKRAARGGTSPNPMSWGESRIDGDAIAGHDDSGGASRFFPTFRYTAKAPSTERPSVDGVAHATVKPLELMRWLIRLVTPPGGTVLDPFAGSGTTGEAAIHEHKHAILIERESTYLPLIVARLSKPMEVGFDFDPTGEFVAETMFTRGGTAAYEPLNFEEPA